MKVYSLRNAMIAGITPAVLEAILILSIEPSVSRWVLLQAVLFWFSCGAVISLIDVRMNYIAKGILFTVFLNLPWYIAESVVAGKPEHLMPLIIASIVQGMIIGFVCKWLDKVSYRGATS